MVKFHKVFLIASLSMSLNLFTANLNESTAINSQSSSFDDSISQTLVTLSRNNSVISLADEYSQAKTPAVATEASEVAAQRSTTLTKIWYGVSKTLGKSATQTLFELAENKTLHADAQVNTEEAIGRVVAATKERFTQRDLTDPSNQKKITEIFKIINDVSDKTSVTLDLPPILAIKYNELQAQALKNILHEQATVYQPAYEEEKKVAIQAAKDLYAQKMSNLLTIAARAADNKRQTHAQSKLETPTNSCSFEASYHYETPTAHETLLQSIRDELAKKTEAK